MLTVPRLLVKTCVLCTVALVALAPRLLDGQSTAPRDTTPEAVVRGFVQAFNAHNLDALLSFVAPEIVWLSVAGDSVTIEARGVGVLREQMGGYFRQLPSARSELETLTTLGPWVSARERVHWMAASGPRSQASLSVYEIRAGLVRRVWYFPVVR
ncbi:MAG: nuclear transport factor 2 family protein [Gemmatimonadales bacterium]